MEIQKLIEACKKDDPMAQRMFYDRFAPSMLGICLRYLGNRADAEDVLIKGMYKALTCLDQFDERGSFEGWLRRIFVNESLMWIRKRDRQPYKTEIEPHHATTTASSVDELGLDDILSILEQLPEGYRNVFNLYVIEGYKHREVSEILGISINTSKSQLILARKKIIQLLEEIGHPEIEKRSDKE